MCVCKHIYIYIYTHTHPLAISIYESIYLASGPRTSAPVFRAAKRWHATRDSRRRNSPGEE